MKYSLLSFLLGFAFAVPLRAESQFEREFKQLQDQRTKAAAAAMEPINRRYQVSLDQLLRRATQGNDLETALKVKQELGGLTGAPASALSATPGTKPATSQAVPDKSSKKAKAEYLTSYRWYFTSVKDSKTNGYLITFKSDGTVDQPKVGDRWTWGQKDNSTILLNGAPLKVTVGEMILERPDTKLGSRYLHRDEPISPQ